MYTSKMRRDRWLNLRCTEKEVRRFKRVATHHEMGVAALIRMLVKREALAIKRDAR